ITRSSPLFPYTTLFRSKPALRRWPRPWHEKGRHDSSPSKAWKRTETHSRCCSARPMIIDCHSHVGVDLLFYLRGEFPYAQHLSKIGRASCRESVENSLV